MEGVGSGDVTDVNESMKNSKQHMHRIYSRLTPSHTKPKFPLRQCKTGPTQYKLARRRRNVVETDKDVILADTAVF